ncbi:MAG: glutamine--fructose-6-phosphate transaminase (isomerizing) [Candidatus Omnitrophica bacterium]|nr:glutamine--fructose-6-phosphate transaminase (isomerizing) [Candidatus Omnitrophota bacterium]
MCGISGYTGGRNVYNIIINCLESLEYRGYDSAGIAFTAGNRLSVIKCKGRIADLKKKASTRKINAQAGIAHTRWATHGKPSSLNAHPHFDSSGRIAVVHNGIIENYIDIKDKLLEKGYTFKSDTDTEVLAVLIGHYYEKMAIEKAILKAAEDITGSYAIGVILSDSPEKIIAMRHDSPLVIGIGVHENFMASDVSAILKYTNKVIYLQDKELAVISPERIEFLNSKPHDKHLPVKINYTIEQAQKTGFKHFMLKEIYEQPKVVSNILAGHITSSDKIHFDISGLDIKNIKEITIVACGTAYHSGLVAKYIIEEFARIPVNVDVGSEFRYRNPIIKDDTLFIAISQSGETADTIAAVREIKKHKVPILAVCNVLGSTLTRESSATVYTNAGPEISVASTKAFTAQITVMYLLGLFFAQEKGIFSKTRLTSELNILKKIPNQQKEIFKQSRKINAIAKKYLNFGAFLFLGRNINYPIALEGALKLKEISYIPAEGYASGEMKHGPIALIDEYRAVVCIANDSFVFDKVLSNIQEILARKGKIIVIATEGNRRMTEFTKETVFISKTNNVYAPLLTTVVLQMFAYYVAVLKGFDVDKPRNLAKSVTVE